MKIKILGAAMALALTAAPVLARHLTYSQGPTQSIFCATRQEIRTVSIATTWPGAAGDGEALGIPVSIMRA